MQLDSLKKELDLHDEVLELKLVRKALDKREHEELEMALQHNLKCIFIGGLKREVEFEKYLEFLRGMPSRLFINLVQVALGYLRSWVGILIRVGYRIVLIVGLVRNKLSMLFLSIHYMPPRDDLL